MSLSYIIFLLVCCCVVLSTRQATMQSLEQRIIALEKTNLDSCGCSSQTPVAFKTHLSHTITPAADQIIVFDDVQLNLGNAYHADSGMFIVPRKGLYIFSLSVCSHAGHYIVINLVRDGTMIGRALAGDSDNTDCSSETTLVQLDVGDQVYLKHHGAAGDFIAYSSDILSSFTGVLLQTM